MSRPSNKVCPWARRTWKNPLRVAQEKAARSDLEYDLETVEVDRYPDDGWTGYSSHPFAAWISRRMDDDDHVVAPKPPEGITYTFACAS